MACWPSRYCRTILGKPGRRRPSAIFVSSDGATHVPPSPQRGRESAPREMTHHKSAPMFCCSIQTWVAVVVGFALVSSSVVSAAVAPLSNCYALGADNQLYDLTNFYGHEFEKEVDKVTYTLRFCKDFQKRRQDSGYINFGTYESGTQVTFVSKETSFVHGYINGDLSGCENHGTEFNGRDTQVSVICGSNCPNTGACKDPSGCICSVTFDDTERPCVASVVLTIPCPPPGPQVVRGFKIGFSNRGQEVVADGLTQWGFESDQHKDYSFETSQSQVFLYFSAPSQVASDIGKPTIATFPSKGLEIKLSGTAAIGVIPTTLAPSLLDVNWRCEAANSYLVNVTVPFKKSDSVVFSLLKLCVLENIVQRLGVDEQTIFRRVFVGFLVSFTQGDFGGAMSHFTDTMQTKQPNASSGWATFGVLSCIFVLMTTMCCSAGFLYQTRVENKHGLEALPGIGILSSCLDAASRDSSGCRRADEGTSIIGDPFREASTSTRRNLEGRYGSV